MWWQEQGNYSTSVFSRVAVDIVESHDTSNPLFLYLPYQVQQQQHSFASHCLQLTLHSPWLVASPGRSFTRRGASTILGYASLAVSHLDTDHGPACVLADPYKGIIDNERRRTFAGMLSAVDEGIANVTAALKRRNMWDNTLLVFTADNGAPICTASAQHTLV